MINTLTIDVEDYFMVSAFADVVKFEDWPKYESRVERNTYKILDLLDEHGVKATFFVLGWVAEHYPQLVKEIYGRGHEVACHSYKHSLIYNLTIDEFREDTRKAKKIIEDVIGNAVIGYRAPSYSITAQSMWALDVLIEEGFSYDSSIFPIHHDRYGVPGSERFSHIIKREMGVLLEIPPSTYRILGNNIPMAGGGYFRLFPLWFTKSAIKRINVTEKKPVNFYFHPWEIDHEQPRLNGNILSKFRHYINLDKTVIKIADLLKSFNFEPIKNVFSVTAKTIV